MRKLGRPTKQRMAILRNLASELLWYGKIETTVDRAKEVRVIAEKMITLAVKTYDDTVAVTKKKKNAKGEVVDVPFKNDGVKKLNARRKIMSVLRDLKELKEDGETKPAYYARTKDVKHPLIEKLFELYGPKYRKRNEANPNVSGGGYTRIVRLEERRGDGAEMALLELI